MAIYFYPKMTFRSVSISDTNGKEFEEFIISIEPIFDSTEQAVVIKKIKCLKNDTKIFEQDRIYINEKYLFTMISNIFSLISTTSLYGKNEFGIGKKINIDEFNHIFLKYMIDNNKKRN